MKLTAGILPIVLVTALELLAQQSKTVQKRTALGGTLSGRIFGVTRGGDFKPAIMANVYLFFEVSVHPDGKVDDIDGDDTAGDIFMRNENKERGAELAEMQRNNWSEHVECLNALLAYRKAIVTTMESVPKNRQWQVVTGETDENGPFRLSVPRQGSWMLVAYGQTGANDAVWEQEGVRVFAGKGTELKLGSTEKACLKIDE